MIVDYLLLLINYLCIKKNYKIKYNYNFHFLFNVLALIINFTINKIILVDKKSNLILFI